MSRNDLFGPENSERPLSGEGMLGFYLRVVVRPNISYASVIVALMLLGATLEMATVALSVPLLNVITQVEGLSNGPVVRWAMWPLETVGLEPTTNAVIMVILTVVVGLFVLSGGARLLHEYLTAAIAHRLHRDMRSRLFERFLYGRFEDTVARGTAQVLYDVRIPSKAVYETIRHLGSLLTAFFNTALLLALMLFLSWRATVVIAVLVAFGVRGLRKVMDERAGEHGKMIYRLQSDRDKTEKDAIDGLRMVKAHGLEPTMIAHQRRLLNAEIPRLMRLTLFRHMPLFLNETTAGVVVLILGAMTFLTTAVGMSLSTLVAFLLAIRRASPAVASINSTIAELNASRRNVEVIDEVLRRTAPEQSGRSRVADIDEVRFEDVCFRYEERSGKRALSNLDFSMKKGTVTVIVGHTGAGKSTVANLLIALFRPQYGRITVDGLDLAQIDLTDWRHCIGYVSQDVFLFNSTIRENIACWNDGVPDEDIEAAARSANIHDFVTTLPDGYDTPVGDRGVKLSGGQCQRIAIARAVLRGPKILVFDEATSALDNQTERAVYDAISRLRRNAIVIVIAHRLSTVQQADQILVLDEGRLVEQGRHETLMQTGGVYRDLYEVDRARQGDKAAVVTAPAEDR